jgi:hypothetical protein
MTRRHVDSMSCNAGLGSPPRPPAGFYAERTKILWESVLLYCLDAYNPKTMFLRKSLRLVSNTLAAESRYCIV